MQLQVFGMRNNTPFLVLYQNAASAGSDPRSLALPVQWAEVVLVEFRMYDNDVLTIAVYSTDVNWTTCKIKKFSFFISKIKIFLFTCSQRLSYDHRLRCCNFISTN